MWYCVIKKVALWSPFAAQVFCRDKEQSVKSHHLATPYAGEDEILQIKTLRHELEARDSPFVETNNAGGGFGAPIRPLQYFQPI